jgi:hypothetical protein
MLTFPKTIEDVSEADLQRLIESLTPESRTLEYKGQLPGRTTEDRKEFLRDVVSFANSVGGHIIYGMEANDGIAATLRGFPQDTIDREILRLEQMIRTGIEPMIQGFKIQSVPLPTLGGCALVAEIPPPLFGPHMIRSRGAFVSRTSAGKMDMDFGEIRAAFVGTETAIAKLNEFRQQRTGQLIAGDMVAPMASRTMLAVHLLPLQSFAPAFRCDLAPVTHAASTENLVIARKAQWGWQPRFTHHGFAQICSAGIYANLFRNGSIEVVDTDVTTNRPGKSILAPAVEWDDFYAGCCEFILQW